MLAEFWADGPNSETPPGHWNVIANQVSAAGSVPKRLGGTGPLLNDLEWDVKLYFALNAALHDAACAAWSLKRYYDGWRPIEAIRYMGQRGQSSFDSDPTYDPAGLPLVPGLIEIVRGTTAAPGGRHAGLPVGSIAILAWPGQPADPLRQNSGVRWIGAADWLPYQKRTFVTPAFPGYISGHSTFSRAAAEVLAAITGSEFFPGGQGQRRDPVGRQPGRAATGETAGGPAHRPFDSAAPADPPGAGVLRGLQEAGRSSTVPARRSNCSGPLTSTRQTRRACRVCGEGFTFRWTT